MSNEICQQNEPIANDAQSDGSLLFSENNIAEIPLESFNFDDYLELDDGISDTAKSVVSNFILNGVSSTAAVINTAAFQDVYKVVFKKGVDAGKLLKNSEGKPTTTYIDKGKFQQAGLDKFSETQIGKTITTVNVVNGVMSIASFALGC